MARSVEEVFVPGWTVLALKREVTQWMMSEKIRIVEEHENSVKGMFGKESRWADPPKNFSLTFLQQPNGVTVQVSGWFMWRGEEVAFSKSILQSRPSRDCWKIMERLLARLRSLPNQQTVSSASIAAVPVQAIRRICPQCGRVLTDEVKFCPYCGRNVG
jgi:hypothetical protein